MTEQVNGSSGEKREPLTFEKHDCFGLEQYAEDLNSLVEVHSSQEEEAYVLSLNAPFGAGKTTFIHMWRHKLENKEKKAACVYINAWEHDFDDEPIIPILNVLLERIPQEDKDKTFAKQIVSAGASIFCDLVKFRYGVDIKKLPEIFSESEQYNSGQQLFDIYSRKITMLKQLRSSLASYVQTVPDKRIMIFIDELDRARPDYSVKFLETIKHIFPVKGLCFILSVNRKQLECSARKLYGEKLDFENYYLRFVSREVTLPNLVHYASLNNYIDKLHDQFVRPLDGRGYLLPYGHHTNEAHYDYLRSFIEIICKSFNLTLREIELFYRKFTDFVVVAKKELEKSKYDDTWTEAAIFLVALSIVNHDMYTEIGIGTPDVAEVLKIIDKPIVRKLSHKYNERKTGNIIDVPRMVLCFLLGDHNKFDIAREYREIRGMTQPFIKPAIIPDDEIELVGMSDDAIIKKLSMYTKDSAHGWPVAPTFQTIYDRLEYAKKLFSNSGHE